VNPWLVFGSTAAVVVENWAGNEIGKQGVPDGWKGQSWGTPKYDFTVKREDESNVLHLRSQGDSSTITKQIKVDVRQTPILEWRWKILTLPEGGDLRNKGTNDQAIQIYVTFPRFPSPIRSRFVGYIWDSSAPEGTVVKGQLVTYIVVRSGKRDMGKWFTESRNVYEDYKNVFGEEPGELDSISITIDSDDTNSTAESFVGNISFKGRLYFDLPRVKAHPIVGVVKPGFLVFKESAEEFTHVKPIDLRECTWKTGFPTLDAVEVGPLSLRVTPRDGLRLLGAVPLSKEAAGIRGADLTLSHAQLGAVDEVRLTEWLASNYRDFNDVCQEYIRTGRGYVVLQAVTSRLVSLNLYDERGARILPGREPRLLRFSGFSDIYFPLEASVGLKDGASIITRSRPVVDLIQSGLVLKNVEQGKPLRLRTRRTSTLEGVSSAEDSKRLSQALKTYGPESGIDVVFDGSQVIATGLNRAPREGEELASVALEILNSLLFGEELSIESGTDDDLGVKYVAERHAAEGVKYLDFLYYMGKARIEGPSVTVTTSRSNIIEAIIARPLLSPDLGAIRLIGDKPAVSGAEAVGAVRRVVLKSIQEIKSAFPNIDEERIVRQQIDATELFYRRSPTRSWTLAWRVEATVAFGLIGSPSVISFGFPPYYVDAMTGTVYEEKAEKGRGANGVRPTYGEGERKKWFSINTFQTHPDEYIMRDAGAPGKNEAEIHIHRGTYGSFAISHDNRWREPENRGAVDTAFNLRLAYRYFKEELGWDWSDERVGPIVALINPSDPGLQNDSRWTGEYFVFGNGDGQLANVMGADLSVVAHEYAHAVAGGVRQERQLPKFCRGDEGERAAALEESIADIFSVFVRMAKEPADVGRPYWRVGQDGMPRLYRDMAEPTVRSHRNARGELEEFHYDARDSPKIFLRKGYPQPGHVNEMLRRRCNERQGDELWSSGTIAHINSGIPNKVAHLLYSSMPEREFWEAVYLKVLDLMRPGTTFANFQTLMHHAVSRLELRLDQQREIACKIWDAWASVGLGDECPRP